MNKTTLILTLSALYCVLITLLYLFSNVHQNENEVVAKEQLGAEMSPTYVPFQSSVPRKPTMAEIDLQSAAIRNSHPFSQSYQNFFWYFLYSKN